MGMHKGKLIYATIYLSVLFALTGCGGSLGVSARDDGKADLSLFMDTGRAASAMISSVMAGLYPEGGAQEGVFSPERAAALEKGLSESGLESVRAKALSSSALSLEAEAGPELFSSLVSMGERSMTLTLSPETMRGLYRSMDARTRGYADLFMAPVFTGDSMSGEEYAALIASVYGTGMAGEISDAVMEISLSAPEGKKAASCSDPGASLSGRRATVFVPLLDLLVLDRELSWEVGW